jgi:hypothetical protein
MANYGSQVRERVALQDSVLDDTGLQLREYQPQRPRTPFDFATCYINNRYDDLGDNPLFEDEIIFDWRLEFTYNIRRSRCFVQGTDVRGEQRELFFVFASKDNKWIPQETDAWKPDAGIEETSERLEVIHDGNDNCYFRREGHLPDRADLFELFDTDEAFDQFEGLILRQVDIVPIRALPEEARYWADARFRYAHIATTDAHRGALAHREPLSRCLEVVVESEMEDSILGVYRDTYFSNLGQFSGTLHWENASAVIPQLEHG